MRLADGSIEGRKGSNGVPMHTVPRTAKMRPTYLFRAQTRLESDHHVHRVWRKREVERGKGKGKVVVLVWKHLVFTGAGGSYCRKTSSASNGIGAKTGKRRERGERRGSDRISAKASAEQRASPRDLPMGRTRRGGVRMFDVGCLRAVGFSRADRDA